MLENISKQMVKENSKNHTTRVGDDFNENIKKINQKRIESGRKSISMKVLTNLLIKHNSWPIIIKDLINFDFKKKNGK